MRYVGIIAALRRALSKAGPLRQQDAPHSNDNRRGMRMIGTRVDVAMTVNNVAGCRPCLGRRDRWSGSAAFRRRGRRQMHNARHKDEQDEQQVAESGVDHRQRSGALHCRWLIVNNWFLNGAYGPKQSTTLAGPLRNRLTVYSP